jgi:hypothetical protein
MSFHFYPSPEEDEMAKQEQNASDWTFCYQMQIRGIFIPKD